MKQSSLENAFHTFKSQTKTLCLATITTEGKPRSSVAPFVQDDSGCFYIFISHLAGHTQDLLSNPQASILLLEDEHDSQQLFARQRIHYDCDVNTIEQTENTYADMLDKLESRFGNIIELLRALPDFVLFQLKPYEGQYVIGFGKAYKLIGNHLDQLEHIESSK